MLFFEQLYNTLRYTEFGNANEQLIVPEEFIDTVIIDALSNAEELNEKKIIHSILIYSINRITLHQAKNICHILDKQKELSSDLVQAIFDRFEDLRSEFFYVEDQLLLKPENLRDVPIEELISDKETWYKLALNEADPYREIPHTKLGLELEFKLQGADQRVHQRINERIETYQDILFSNDGKILWQDQGVAEIAVGGQNGLAMSRDLLLKIDGLITELEKSPEFIAWGSTHIHVDSYRGMDIDNSLFYFNDYNGDGKGFETKEVPLASPGSVNRYSYILESQTVADQMRTIALLYQSGTDTITATQAINYLYDLSSKGKNKAIENMLLYVANDIAPEAIPSILRLGAKNRLPYLNEYALVEKIDTLPGTVEAITAIAQVKDFDTQVHLVEKVGTLPGTVDIITAIAQVKGYDAQNRLAEAIGTLPGTVDVITAIAQLKDYGAQEYLAAKIDVSKQSAEGRKELRAFVQSFDNTTGNLPESVKSIIISKIADHPYTLKERFLK